MTPETTAGAHAAQAPRLAPPYQVIRNFLDPADVTALLDYAEAHEAEFAPSTLYDGTHVPTIRVSSVLSDFGRFDALLQEKVRALIPSLTTRLRVTPFEEARIEVELVAHNDGAFYLPHIDTYSGRKTDLNSVRVISGVYYVHREPKAYTGGALRLFDFQRDEREPAYVDFEPERNMLLVFPSWARHEVRPVACPSRRFMDSRFAVNCWIQAKLAGPSA